MTNIRHTLQTEFFSESDETLFCVTSIGITDKRKSHYLCIAVSNSQPVQALLHHVVLSEKQNKVKKKGSWLLADLRLLDGQADVKDSTEIIMVFDKTYQWTATSIPERDLLIESLWRVCGRYLSGRKPDFKNVSNLISFSEEKGRMSERRTGTLSEHSDQPIDRWELTSKELQDLERTLMEAGSAINDADAFSERLSKELYEHEWINIKSITGSEEKTRVLANLIDKCLDEIEGLETKLNCYDDLVKDWRETIEGMERREAVMDILDLNRQKLLDEVSSVLDKVTVNEKDIQTLINFDYSSSKQIQFATTVLQNLVHKRNLPMTPGLGELVVVKKQLALVDDVLNSFFEKFFVHILRAIPDMINESCRTESHFLPKHRDLQQQLMVYHGLIQLFKEHSPGKHKQLIKVCLSVFGDLHQKEIKEYLDVSLRNFLTRSRASVPVLVSEALPFKTAPMATSKESVHSAVSHESFTQGQDKLHTFIESVLSDFQTYILAEQDFLTKFLSLNSSDTDLTQVSMATDSATSVDGAFLSTPKPKMEAANSQKSITNDVLQSMENDIRDFIEGCEKLDIVDHKILKSASSLPQGLIINMQLIVIISNTSINRTSGIHSSYIDSAVLGVWLVSCKRRFDINMSTVQRLMEEAKPQKKGRHTILPSLQMFEEFLTAAETIFKNAERRSELEKAYRSFLVVLLRVVERAASEHEKYPEALLVENYHRVLGLVSSLRQASLDVERKELKVVYQKSIDHLVSMWLGKPLEKLSVFFDGVEQKIASGVRPEDISYQMAFSRQELKRVIKEYPGKEVKKSLEALYRRIDKCFSDTSLIQVVWTSVQQDFMRQYDHFVRLIAKCYAGGDVELEFSAQDLLSYFTLITQSQA